MKPITPPITDVDKLIGEKLRERRIAIKLSQSDLSKILNISYQQIQKYEKGNNKIPAGRLFQIAKILRVTPDYFFSEIKFDIPNSHLEAHNLHIVDAKPLNILLIEGSKTDEILTCEAIKSSKIKCDVTTVNDGEQAIIYLKDVAYKNNPTPDLILLDLNVTKIIGLEILQMIRGNTNIQNIPVIALTNSINLNNLKSNYRKYANGFIHKSFDINDYKHKINTSLDYWANIAISPVK